MIFMISNKPNKINNSRKEKNLKQKTISKKGFIGSIGDDLPSLIPLFFSLMIFFAGLAFAFTTINDRNTVINTYVDSLTIARTALSDGSFASIEEFLKTQKDLVTMSNYFYGLIYLDPNNPNFNFESLFDNDFSNVFIMSCNSNDGLSNTTILSYLSDPQIKITNNEYDNCIPEKYFVYSASINDKINDPNLLQEIKSRNYFYYLYPVNILTSNGYKVVYLIIMVW